jgi:hypothetical protein
MSSQVPISRGPLVSPLIASIFLASLCVFGHFLASSRMEFRASFALHNVRTTHGMQLVEFLEANLWLPAGYLLVATALFVFSSARRHPAWAGWLCFMLLASPGVCYLYVCSYLAGKIIRW